MKDNTREIIGKTFGFLTALEVAPSRGRTPYFRCTCICGNIREVSKYDLLRGHSKSCGCKKALFVAKSRTKHGASGRGRKRPEYSIWEGIKKRCLNPSNKLYRFYGARGISLYEPWVESFEDFFSYVGARPTPAHSLDRIDNEKGYEPDNLRWATKTEQANNMRTNVVIEYNGQAYTMAQLTQKLGLGYHSFAYLYRTRKLPLEEAIAKATKI